MGENVYIVAGSKSWNRRTFDEKLRNLPGEWHFFGTSEELTPEKVRELNPKYLFFLHWSWKVPSEVFQSFECVCFHMTDVPYGRGGSPLQNLITRGHRSTQLSALKMTEQFDAGPVYLKTPLSLEGGAEEILIRSSAVAATMIREMVSRDISPLAQAGEPVVFKRRTPRESELPGNGDLGGLHDFIRMLDAEGYPNAYFERGGFRFEFSRSAFYEGRLKADVTVTKVQGDEK